MESVEQIVTKYVLDTTQAKAALGEISTGITSTTTTATEAMGDLQQATEQAISTKTVQAGIDSMNDLGDSIGDVEKKTVSLRAQIRQNVQELGKMKLAGKENTKAFEELTKETGKLQKAMNIVKESIQSSSQQFIHLKAGAEALRGLTAGYETMIGVQSLFGDKNEEVEKSLRKIMGVMALINGMTELSNIMKADSVLMTDLANIKENILTKSKWLNVEATLAEKAAEGGYITLALAGVAALTAGIYTLISREKEHAEHQREFTEELTRQNTELEHQIALNNAIGVSSADLEKQRAANSIKAIENDQAEAERKRSSSLRVAAQSMLMGMGIGTGDWRSEEQKVEDAKMADEKQKQANKLVEIDFDTEVKLDKLQQESIARSYQAYKEGAQKERALYIHSRDVEEDALKDKLMLETDYAKKQAQIKIFEDETNRRLLEMDIKAELDTMNQVKSIMEANGQNTLSYQQKIIDKEKEMHIAGSSEWRKLMTEDKLLRLEQEKQGTQIIIDSLTYQMEVKKQFGESEYGLQMKIYDREIELAGKNALKVQAIERQRQLYKNEQAKKAINDYFNAIAGADSRAGATLSTQQQIQSSQEMGPVQRAELEKKQHEESYALQRKTLQDELTATATETDKAKQLQKQLDIKNKIKNLDATAGNQGTLDDKAIFKAQVTEANNYANLVLNTTKQLGDQVARMEEDRLKQKFDREKAALAAWHDHAINQVGLSAKQREMIERASSQRSLKIQHDQAIAEAKIKRDQAIMNKTISIAQITLKMAETVAEYMSNPTTIPLLVGALAADASQLAIAAAIPIPQIPKFATGVIGFQGAGTETSDSNIVAISKGESVITAATTKRYEAELQAMEANQLENMILNKYLKPMMAKTNPVTVNTEAFDDFMLRADVRQGNKYLKKLVENTKGGGFTLMGRA